MVGLAMNASPTSASFGMMALVTVARSAYLPYWASAVLPTCGRSRWSSETAAVRLSAQLSSAIGAACLAGVGHEPAQRRPVIVAGVLWLVVLRAAESEQSQVVGGLRVALLGCDKLSPLETGDDLIGLIDGQVQVVRVDDLHVDVAVSGADADDMTVVVGECCGFAHVRSLVFPLTAVYATDTTRRKT